MALIQTPEIIRFCNEKIRPASDALGSLYYACKIITDENAARSVIPAILDPTDQIDDGAATDGRAPINVRKARKVLTIAAEIVAYFEANAKEKLNDSLVVSTNVRPIVI